MEKILLPFNSTAYNARALDFAGLIAKMTGSGITGLFLENLGQAISPELIAERKQLTEKSIGLFKEACESRSLHQCVKREAGNPVDEVIAESRYADLIILDAATSFAGMVEDSPTHFVKQILSGAECPVVIVPQRANEIDEIIFMFDGSSSCMFAARQFSYLFPELDDKKVTVVHIDNGHPLGKNDKAKMKNWVKEHYSSIGFSTIEGDPAGEMYVHLVNRKNVFVVAGAYGRNAVSQFFHRSAVELLIRTIPHALFIAHH